MQIFQTAIAIDGLQSNNSGKWNHLPACTGAEHATNIRSCDICPHQAQPIKAMPASIGKQLSTQLHVMHDTELVHVNAA